MYKNKYYTEAAKCW